jgi:hypothetical protein
LASAFDRLGSISPTRFCSTAIVVIEEDIASSFEELQTTISSFFFGFLGLKVQDILADLCSPSASQALSFLYLPVKRENPLLCRR